MVGGVFDNSADTVKRKIYDAKDLKYFKAVNEDGKIDKKKLAKKEAIDKAIQQEIKNPTPKDTTKGKADSLVKQKSVKNIN